MVEQESFFGREPIEPMLPGHMRLIENSAAMVAAAQRWAVCPESGIPYDADEIIDDVLSQQFEIAYKTADESDAASVRTLHVAMVGMAIGATCDYDIRAKWLGGLQSGRVLSHDDFTYLTQKFLATSKNLRAGIDAADENHETIYVRNLVDTLDAAMEHCNTRTVSGTTREALRLAVLGVALGSTPDKEVHEMILSRMDSQFTM